MQEAAGRRQRGARKERRVGAARPPAPFEEKEIDRLIEHSIKYFTVTLLTYLRTIEIRQSHIII